MRGVIEQLFWIGTNKGIKQQNTILTEHDIQSYIMHLTGKHGPEAVWDTRAPTIYEIINTIPSPSSAIPLSNHTKLNPAAL